jgi:predicted RNA methylase
LHRIRAWAATREVLQNGSHCGCLGCCRAAHYASRKKRVVVGKGAAAVAVDAAKGIGAVNTLEKSIEGFSGRVIAAKLHLMVINHPVGAQVEVLGFLAQAVELAAKVGTGIEKTGGCQGACRCTGGGQSYE